MNVARWVVRSLNQRIPIQLAIEHGQSWRRSLSWLVEIAVHDTWFCTALYHMEHVQHCTCTFIRGLFWRHSSSVQLEILEGDVHLSWRLNLNSWQFAVNVWRKTFESPRRPWTSCYLPSTSRLTVCIVYDFIDFCRNIVVAVQLNTLEWNDRQFHSVTCQLSVKTENYILTYVTVTSHIATLQ